MFIYDTSGLNSFNLDWKNPPRLEVLKQDYSSAKNYHNNIIAKIKEWRTILLAPDRNFGKNRSKITPKIAKKQAEWTYPVIEEPMLSNRNMFSVDPITAEDPQLAYENSVVLNHQMNKEMDKVKIISDATRRFVDDGTCIVKIGWNRKETYKEEFEPIFIWIPIQDPALRQEAIMNGVPPYERVQRGWKKVRKRKIIKNAPLLEVMDPAMVIIDPNAQGDIDKAQFIIEEFDTNLSNLRKKGIYKNLDLVEKRIISEIKDKSDELPDNDMNNDSFNFSDSPRKILRAVRYWGYWDIDGKGTTSPFVATWIGDVLIHIERNPTPYIGLPFEIAHYKPVHKSNYGEPDAEIIKDNQEIIGAVTRGWIDIMGRSASGQTARMKGYVDKLNKIKMENGEDYEYNAGIDPRMGIYMHQFPEIGQTPLTMIQMQENDIESLTGRKAFTGGITGQALGDTAMAVRSALDATAKREMGILRRFTSMFERIARKIIAMNQVFLTDEQIYRITNSDYLIKNRDKDIAKYDLHIEIETPEQKQAKVERIAFLMQTMGNSLPFDFTRMQLEKMYRLENMPDLAQKIKEFEPQPDPMEQQMKQLELALLQAQLGQIQASTQEDLADVQLKGAKAQETMMKAQMLGSEKDLKDLDYTDRIEGKDIAKQMAIEAHKTDRELLKEKMKQDIVASQLNHNKEQKDIDRVKDISERDKDRRLELLKHRLGQIKK